jgi:hypothetical protein
MFCSSGSLVQNQEHESGMFCFSGSLAQKNIMNKYVLLFWLVCLKPQDDESDVFESWSLCFKAEFKEYMVCLASLSQNHIQRQPCSVFWPSFSKNPNNASCSGGLASLSQKRLSKLSCSASLFLCSKPHRRWICSVFRVSLVQNRNSVAACALLWLLCFKMEYDDEDV